jgi:hypothetical protein
MRLQVRRRGGRDVLCVKDGLGYPGLRPVNCALPYLVYHPSRCICLPMCCFILLYSYMSLYPIFVLTYGLLCLA